MQIYLSTADFKLKGFSYPGIPILVTKDNTILLEVLDFVVYYCIECGRVKSTNSWETYGRDLYDYFSFIEANDFDWRTVKSRTGSMLLAVYRDTSMNQFGLSANTVNRRLRITIQFYQYAVKCGWVESLPYKMENVIVRKTKSFLSHTSSSGSIRASPHVLAKSSKSHIKVLSYSQIRALLVSIKKRKLKLMVRLMLSTGLRHSEVLTFQVKYVISPDQSGHRTHIPVDLNPLEMKIKGDKPRTIMIPVKVMSELWDFLIYERQDLVVDDEKESENLFLTRDGQAYAEGSNTLNNELKKLGLPFHISPHILRHTYATQILKSLECMGRKNFNSLIYVRDRLGHESINTTMVYLHYLDQLEDDLNIEYQNEIDRMCEEIIQ